MPTSKWFRVATEGATTDGRSIDRSWIEQMAKNFNPKKYGARVWLEHMRSLYPDSTFRAYGDVVAVKADKVEDGKLALFAQIEPLPDLVALTKAKQKIYTSIEVHPKFADTGEAYLTGLGVTDTPASLGTDVLSFAAQNPKANPFAGRKSHPDTLFSEAVEVELEFEDGTGDIAAKFSDQVKGILAKLTGKGRADDARFSEVGTALEAIADAVADLDKRYSTAQADSAQALQQSIDELQAKFKALADKLDTTPHPHHAQRPPATGNHGSQVLTDY